MADLTRDSGVKLRIHGLRAFRGKVSARVFTSKLNALVRAIAAADKSANGNVGFKLLIEDLKAESASVSLSEIRSTKKMPMYSGIHVFGECVRAVEEERFTAASAHRECVDQIRSLCSGVTRSFESAELSVNGFPPLVIDAVFLDRIERAMKHKTEIDNLSPRWYKGRAEGSFDGKLLESDLRRDIPQVILVLTSGNNEVPGYCINMTVDDIRPHLGNRVRVFGTAHYDGTSGLPAKIDIKSFKPVKTGVDFSKWEGSFNPFTIKPWDGNQ